MVSQIIEFCARNRLVVLFGVAIATAGGGLVHPRTPSSTPSPTSPTRRSSSSPSGWAAAPRWSRTRSPTRSSSALISAPKVADVRGYSMFGMSFVYVIFEEGTDIYWARSRVLEYLAPSGRGSPTGVAPTLGPGRHRHRLGLPVHAGGQERQDLLDELRTFQDFTLRYALGARARRRRGGQRRRLPEAVPGHRRPQPAARLRRHASRRWSRAIRDSNQDVGGRVIEMSGREYYVRGRGYIQDLGDAGLARR